MLPGEKYGTVALDRADEVKFFKKMGIIDACIEVDELPHHLTREQTEEGIQKLMPRWKAAALVMRSYAWGSELNQREGVERQLAPMAIPDQAALVQAGYADAPIVV